ncbi:hypothetical protein BJ508DRAFT_121537 [Ascobolus immersus RN42]|uniref:Uncharacterized protein n=1 Tax=Ascobolus immersus RN42 TaxID=1160509 RepID=A0A3N4IL69_ASCIM|nr:hypothetical protein BJ508DRAFT_121537 [Ascobolus immersus RN42]
MDLTESSLARLKTTQSGPATRVLGFVQEQIRLQNGISNRSAVRAGQTAQEPTGQAESRRHTTDEHPERPLTARQHGNGHFPKGHRDTASKRPLPDSSLIQPAARAKRTTPPVPLYELEQNEVPQKVDRRFNLSFEKRPRYKVRDEDEVHQTAPQRHKHQENEQKRKESTSTKEPKRKRTRKEPSKLTNRIPTCETSKHLTRERLTES